MTTFTIDDLKAQLSQTIGDDESVDLSGDILDANFSELGFDSLAIIETTSRVEQQCGISLPEAETAAAETPRALLLLIDRALSDRTAHLL